MNILPANILANDGATGDGKPDYSKILKSEVPEEITLIRSKFFFGFGEVKISG
jgi:hypothetical protein